MAVTRTTDKPESCRTRLESFPPVVHPNARVLILGSMPGIASLNAGQYYAHPQNLFWKVMAEITGLPHTAPYEERLACLGTNGIALWDVLQSCTREGSLDSAIQAEEPNDFKNFLIAYNRIERICFNGKKAETSFLRYIGTLKNAESVIGTRQLISLPSTSPANASISYKTKLDSWKDALL